MGLTYWLGIDSAQSSIQNKMHRQMMVQREVQMAVGMAQARDSLQWFGGLYTFFLTALSTAKLAKKPVPALAALPVVVGAFGLVNMWDVAYGSKMSRVVKEAEFILDNERERFVPPTQAPFHYQSVEPFLLTRTHRTPSSPHQHCMPHGHLMTSFFYTYRVPC